MPIGLKGNNDGSGAIQIGGSDAISITTGLNTTFAGTVTAGAITSSGLVTGTTGALYPIVSGTSVSASGTAVDFTGIPAWVKRITVMLNGVSTNGTNALIVQVGTSAGFIDTGYISVAQSGGTQSTATAGFRLHYVAQTAADSYSGVCTLGTLGSDTWIASGIIQNGALVSSSSGVISLSGVLDRVRVTTVGATNTFDAGSINVLYE